MERDAIVKKFQSDPSLSAFLLTVQVRECECSNFFCWYEELVRNQNAHSKNSEHIKEIGNSCSGEMGQNCFAMKIFS